MYMPVAILSANQKQLEFRDTINLTNNETDSVYGQVSALNDNVYVVWHEYIPDNNIRNYDILFKRSTDNGSTFEQEINLCYECYSCEYPYW